jgi:probable HAF family extracellular repeat protein
LYRRSSLLPFSDGSYTTIDVPGASATQASGINDSGQIVGSYDAATATHGFLYSGGSFTTIDAPGASFTRLFSINDSGQIIGISNGVFFSFLYSDGSFTRIDDVPGASPGSTRASAINNSGQIVGSYFDSTGNHSFLFSDGSFTTIDVLNHNSIAEGINDSGQIVGYYFDSTGTHGFLATPTVVPEPRSLPLLVACLIGLAVVLQRKSAPVLRK